MYILYLEAFKVRRIRERTEEEDKVRVCFVQCVVDLQIINVKR